MAWGQGGAEFYVLGCNMEGETGMWLIVKFGKWELWRKGGAERGTCPHIKRKWDAQIFKM